MAFRRMFSCRAMMGLMLAACAGTAWAADAAKIPPAPPADPRELPSYMIPIEPDAAEAYYAPDSYHLIAQTRDPIATKSAHGGMGSMTYVFSDDGKEITRINDRGQDACSFFFPDMKRIIWTSTRDHMDFPVGDWSDSNNYPQGGELYISDWQGKNIKRMTNNKYYEAEVSVSPDGEWITFGRQIDGKMDIWVMKSDGTQEHQVTHTDDWQEGAPFFAQDNDHIIFRAWRASEYRKISPTPMTVFTIKKDGTDWRRHTYDRGMNWHPFLAADGHHYTYIRATTAGSWQVFMGDLMGGEPKQLTFREGFNGLAHTSPNGKKMAWARSTGKDFMSGIRTFVMDVSSLDIGPERKVAYNPNWGQPMQDDPPAAK